MNVLVLGYGISGKSAEALLQAEGHSVTAVDRKNGTDRADLSLEGFSLVILSPGVPPTHPIVVRAKEQKIEVIGEIELGARRLKNRCFGITGANGKTTTVLLTTHILNKAGKKARALGNVGDPFSKYAIDADKNEILIVELSSFQLETLEAKFLEAAIVLNITPNHLDRYLGMNEYAEAKARIGKCLKDPNNLFISKQVETEFGHLFKGARNFEVECKIEESYIDLEMPSKQSIQAAFLLCKRCGVTDSDFLEGLKSYKSAPHRIEWVAKIDGVPYYNDSKSSNVHSVMHAVEKLKGPIVLIAGGLHKGSSYKPWVDCFRGKVKKMIAYGQAAELMELELKNYFPVQKVGPLSDAVQIARTMAENGDTVLLSPGCSSYDQFENYERRGDAFKRQVLEWI